MRGWVWLACLFVLPVATACTSTSSPGHPVDLVVVEDGAEVLRWRTTLSWGANAYCSVTHAPALAFDGRFAAWQQEGRTHVLDSDTLHHATYADGATLTNGTLAFVEGDADATFLRQYDLRSGEETQHHLAAGSLRVAAAPGAIAVAHRVDLRAWQVNVYDPVSLTQRFAAPTLHGDVEAYSDVWPGAASDEWVVVKGGSGQGWVIDGVGSVHNVTFPHDAPRIVGIVADRIYFVTPGSDGRSGAPASPAHAFSLRLPAFDDAQDGQMLMHTGHRHALFDELDGGTGGASPTGAASQDQASTGPENATGPSVGAAGPPAIAIVTALALAHRLRRT